MTFSASQTEAYPSLPSPAKKDSGALEMNTLPKSREHGPLLVVSMCHWPDFTCRPYLSSLKSDQVRLISILFTCNRSSLLEITDLHRSAFVCISTFSAQHSHWNVWETSDHFCVRHGIQYIIDIFLVQILVQSRRQLTPSSCLPEWSVFFLPCLFGLNVQVI